PRIDLFADATYANPNSRAFPPKQAWEATWDAGVRLTWTINDTMTAVGASAEAKAKSETGLEQKGSYRDAVRVEVGAAYEDVKKAPATIEAADRGVVSSEEALRVQNELFAAGKANAVSLVDAETELTRARLNRIDAHIGSLVAEARLDHATGRDVGKGA